MNKFLYIILLVSLLLLSSGLNAQCTDCDDTTCLTCDGSTLANGISGTLPSCPFPCPARYLCVICDLTKIEKAGCFGPPDLVVEILSPHTSQKDIDKSMISMKK